MTKPRIGARKKTPKGNVAISVDRERLRLSWHYEGKRKYFFLGLPDSPLNRSVATKIAMQVQSDLATGNYDPTLNKYRINPIGTPESREKIDDLLKRFWKDRAKKVTSESTRNNYQHAVDTLKGFYQKEDLQVADIKAKDVGKFIESLRERLSYDTLKTYLNRLRAMWRFAGIEPNIWQVPITRTEPRPVPKPFTQDEVKRILEVFKFKETKYSDFVEVLFKTGLRPGEAIGLRWRNVSLECDRLVICETGIDKRPVKNGKVRYIQVSKSVQEILQRRKKEARPGDEFVFAKIDSKSLQRTWVKVLGGLGIEYRKFYYTRSTFISHALAAGIPPVELARQTGHDVATMYAHYAASVNQNLKLPEVF